MSRPQYLKEGDRVAIAAPARKITPDELLPAVKLLESWGLEVELPEHLYDSDNQFAGSDKTRAKLLQKLLDDPEVRAIFCARGGYGTVRIIDALDWSRFAQSPKWIVGYSDVTVLHSHIHRNTGIETLHATMAIDIPADATEKPYRSTVSMKQALSSRRSTACGGAPENPPRCAATNRWSSPGTRANSAAISSGPQSMDCPT